MKLCSMQILLCQNVTEACLLTGTQYKEEWSIGELERLAEKIAGSGPAKVVITGIEKKNYVANLCYEKGAGYEMIQTEKIGSPRSGNRRYFCSDYCGRCGQWNRADRIGEKRHPGLSENAFRDQ